MESTPVLSMGLSRRTAAVNVLLLMDEHRRAAGARLSQIREQREWSQERLAHEAGLSVKTVGRFERGEHDGRPATVKRLAKALDVDPEAITGPPPPPLGLGETQLDRLEKRLDNLAETLENMSLMLAEYVAADAPPEKPRKPHTTPRRSAAKRKKQGAG